MTNAQIVFSLGEALKEIRENLSITDIEYFSETPYDVRMKILKMGKKSLGLKTALIVYVRGTNEKKISQNTLSGEVSSEMISILRKAKETFPWKLGKVAAAFPEILIQYKPDQVWRTPFARYAGVTMSDFTKRNKEWLAQIGGNPDRFDSIASLIYDDPKGEWGQVYSVLYGKK